MYLDLHSNRFTSFPTYILKMNCIANLDISRNDIGPSFALDSYLRCPTLKQLNLSYNQLVCIPEFLTNVAENLEQLLLEGWVALVNRLQCNRHNRKSYACYPEGWLLQHGKDCLVCSEALTLSSQCANCYNFQCCITKYMSISVGLDRI